MPFLLESSAFQVDACFEGLPESAWDERLAETSMSPREMLVHLCEVYTAFQVIAHGGKYEWGSYVPPTTEPLGLLEAMRKLRTASHGLAMSSSDDMLRRNAVDYLALHDAYHVGQMVEFRMRFTPDWDTYSIYRHH